ncbi:MAG TPA: MotA/TolQ/ExbB proton channel family protein [Aliidongia sp.]|nr:MotA/TolQ/ExbB proton channel family protein [Aliidongia sp.]
MSFVRLAELAAASGGILFLMPFMLLAALTVSFERIWYLGRMLARSRRVTARLAPLAILDRQILRAEIERLHGGPVARLLGVALEAAGDRTLLATRCEEAIMLEVPAIDRSLWVLDTIITLAPLLGLLGTIVGMFNAFQVLGKPGSAPTEVTGGVAEALIATAAGLLIAIVGIAFFNGLQTRVRLQVHELETLKTMLLNRPVAEEDAEAAADAPLIHLVGAAVE